MADLLAGTLRTDRETRQLTPLPYRSTGVTPILQVELAL